MRKFLTVSFGTLLLFISCQKTDSVPSEDQNFEITERSCAAQDVLAAQMAADPTLADRMNAIEVFTRKAIEQGQTSRLENGVIIIPVVVHVLYNTAAENISDDQIKSQIEVLNEDFNLQNADTSKVPSDFKDELTNVGIKFELARTIRKYTSKKSWTTNDAIKKSSQGGSDPLDPSYYLNMWSGNLGRGLLGYAQFPGGNPATDGVVILYSALGRRGTLIANYNLGRTATHEVGHWMNLRHIWGDATCGSDFVGDTPQHNTSNTGCPAYGHTSTCTGNPLEMWMNYMDYTYDRCMFMFSNGQRDRMKAVFASGGPRASFAK